ncbi:MAG: biotin--[acetyl-CoA-carboxylase] ligase, partial [Dehalococcoidia bacterium]|jgi:BirA family biotin operon repressor/biotin-[acetyl-CoA-carboxylase] ligase
MEAAGGEIPRVKLLQGILVEFESLYGSLAESGFEPLRRTWKDLSDTIGAKVVVTLPTGQVKGLAIDIDSDGALLLEKGNGDIERIVGGVVRLRKLQE